MIRPATLTLGSMTPLLLLWTLVAAQDTGYQELVDVDIVDVDVNVVDRKGRPVTGLTVEDFQLFVDGEPVLLTNFLAVAEGVHQPDPQPLASPQPTVSPDGSRTTARSTPRDPSPSHLVIYVDNLNTRPAGRQRVLKQLKKYVRTRLRPQDRVMVVNYDRSLNVHLPFTTDPEAIEQALTELLDVPALGFRQDRLRQDVMGHAQAVGCLQGQAYARDFSAQVYADVDASILALESLIGSLAGIQGQKALLYVSDGLQTRAGEDIYYMLATLCAGDASRILSIPAEYDHTRTLRKLTAHANSNRVTLFPLDAIGIMTPSTSDVEIGPRRMAMTGERGSMTSSSDTAAPYEGPPMNLGAPGAEASTLDLIVAANRQGSLFYMGQQTGGQAVLNANNLLPDLRRIDARLHNYYSLGFQPTLKGDGQIHQLRVRLNRPELNVSHRQSFADLPWEERMADRLQSLVAYSGHWDNPLNVQVETVETVEVGGGAPGKGLYEAQLRFRLPAANLLLAPTDDGRQIGNLRLLLSSQGDDGGRTGVRSLSLPIAFSAVQLQDHPDLNTVHYLDITLRATSRNVGLAILDEAARIASFVSHDIEIPTN